MKVLVFGLGLNGGGVGSAKYFAKHNDEVRVTDLKSADSLKPSADELKKFSNISYTFGEHKNKDIDWADLIIKNPSVKPGNPYIEYAKRQGKEIETDMGIFLQFVKPSQIIGITGTKGKSTTASLIYDVLNKIKPDTVFAGNIGKSVLDTIPFITPETLVILEISSFQLEAFNEKKLSPKWAVISNITPDHLNYYQTMDEYISAKKIIGKYQTKDDFLLIRKHDPVVDQKDFLAELNGNIIRFSKDDLPKNFNPGLSGIHNMENMAAALAVAKTFGIDKKSTLKKLQNFKGVPFRMELIRVWNGIKIYNDTTATGPDAGIRALQTLPNCILIAGGMNKNMPYEEYVKTLEENAKKVFFLEGDSTEEIKRLIINKDLIAGTYNDLETLLIEAKEMTKDGDVILFSPAATSFNLFQNEFDRGRKFNEAVRKVFK